MAVNKIDSRGPDRRARRFYRLGEKRLFFISAEHKIGLSDLEEAIADALPRKPGTRRPPIPAAQDRHHRPDNVGKSSLANRLCGEERFIVSELPGTTRDSTDVLIRTGGRGPISSSIWPASGKLTRVSDERESAGVIKASKNIPLADVLCLVLDAGEFPPARTRRWPSWPSIRGNRC